MSSFDRLGRLIAKVTVEHRVERGNVAQCGPDEFIVCHYTEEPELSVYNSALKCLRNVWCKNFSSICCNSAFVFGLWCKGIIRVYESNDDDDDAANGKQQEQYSRRMIQVCHLDTLSEAFTLRVPEKYTMERIMADEQHVVAMSRLSSERLQHDSESRHWFMSIFDLQAIAQKKDNNTILRFFRAERHIDLDMHSPWVTKLFLLDGWLVALLDDELVWFDKQGKRSQTITRFDNMSDVRAIYFSGSGIFIGLEKDKLLMKIK